jgi:pilus assembly protein CpaE
MNEMIDETLRAGLAGLGDLDRGPAAREQARARFTTSLEALSTADPAMAGAGGPPWSGDAIGSTNGWALFCDPVVRAAQRLRAETGGIGVIFTQLTRLRDHLMVASQEDTIVFGPGVSDGEAFAVADHMRVHRPSLGVIVVRNEVTTPLLREALRAGVREVVDHRDTLGLRAAVKRSAHLAATLRARAPVPLDAAAPAPAGGGTRGRVITVFSSKGGCGKTTIATNLAAGLAERGRRRVVILDLDLAFGDVAVATRLFPARTIADAVPLNGAIDATAVRAMLTPHSAGLSVIAAPTEPTASESIPATLVSHLIDVLRGEFDCIVIDTPPNFEDPVLAALDVSDLIALVATPDLPALKNLKISMETLVELSYSREKFRLILNRSDAKVGISHSEVEKTAQMSLSARIPSSRDVSATVNRGVLIVQDDPKHPVSLAIRRFADADVAGVEASRNGGAAKPAGRTLMTKRRPRS